MKTPTIKGVAELVLNVRDITAMTQFYEQVLGFRLHSQFPEGDPTIVFLTIADLDTPLGRGGHPQLFALIDIQRDPVTRDTYTGLDHQRSPLNHLAFEIDPSALTAHKEHLENRGLSVEVIAFPNMQATGLFFHDPEGNMIELIGHSPPINPENASE